MALTRPSLPENTIMDASVDNVIMFEALGGDRVVGFDVQIAESNNLSKLIYSMSEKKDTYNRIHIPANSLPNGAIYQIRVRTYNETGEFSNWSDYGLLNCYVTPVCVIDNIPIVDEKRVVPEQNYIFVGSYHQNEGIAISRYQYVLYNSEKELIQQFDSVNSNKIISNNELSQRVEGFEVDTKYYVELKCTDINGLEVSSGLISFVAEYEVPRIRQIVELENEAATASVKISSDMIQIIFKIEDGSVPVYINEQELQLYKYVVNKDGQGNTIRKRIPIVAYVDEYLNIPSNFTLKIYCKSIPRSSSGEEKYFLTLTSADGLTKIQMKEYDNRIHVYKTQTPKPSGADIRGHYVSDEIVGYRQNISYVAIQISHVNGRLDVFAKVMDLVT